MLQLSLVACDGGGNTATPTADQSESNGAYTLRVGTSVISVTEGGSSAAVVVSVIRDEGHTLPINITAEGVTPTDTDNLRLQFEDEQLTTDESGTAITINLDIGDAPLLPEERQIIITASDGSNDPINTTLTLNVEPTDLPDIYLLVGQSNMVGFSEDNSKQSGEGQLDAPDARIFQLNVTGNDQENFRSETDFVDVAQIAVPDPRYTLAADPLHDGFDAVINGKEGQRIGLGLSFGKQMLSSTTADIYLVPAAWSDTGFCSRGTNLFEGLGWLPTTSGDPAFAGTLLHDRALARLNLTLSETDGIFRGILWHQGEADSDDTACATSYEQNLSALANSLRSNAMEDARGASARGENANIPFVVGTMSVAIRPFSDDKQLVDDAHRTVSTFIANSDVVLTDDILPPAFACGEGSCIHYGAAGYREMGARYAEKMQALQRQ
jgi:hypothetical protein